MSRGGQCVSSVSMWHNVQPMAQRNGRTAVESVGKIAECGEACQTLAHDVRCTAQSWYSGQY